MVGHGVPAPAVGGKVQGVAGQAELVAIVSEQLGSIAAVRFVAGLATDQIDDPMSGLFGTGALILMAAAADLTAG